MTTIQFLCDQLANASEFLTELEFIELFEKEFAIARLHNIWTQWWDLSAMERFDLSMNTEDFVEWIENIN